MAQTRQDGNRESAQMFVVALAVIALIGIIWFSWNRLTARYRRTEPPNTEKPLPRVQRPPLFTA